MHIEFTLSTVPLALLAAFLCYLSKGRLLPVVMFLSVFQAASLFNLAFGGLLIGVQPSYFVLVCALIARAARHCPNVMPRLSKPSPNVTLLLAGFVLYGATAAFANPFLFAGVLVSNPKTGFGVPLAWELGHLNQTFYLLLSLSLYWMAAYWTTPAELLQSLRWFVAGTVFASLVGLYQFASLKTGLPFPSEILHSNPTYSMFEGYEIDGFPRMNSTFSEAAAAAFSISTGLAIALWRFLSRADSLRNLAAVLTIATGLALTISTTGYLCLAFLLIVVAVRHLAPWRGTAEARVARLLMAIPVLLFSIACLAVPTLRSAVVSLSHTVLIDKTNSVSYQVRAQWNRDAFQTAADTLFLGAGWGVSRASSFVPTVLANVGLPGTLLLLAFLIRLFQPAFRFTKPKLPVHGAALLALGAVVVNLLVSAPDLTHPVIWLLFAVAAILANRRASPRAFFAPAPAPSEPLGVRAATP